MVINAVNFYYCLLVCVDFSNYFSICCWTILTHVGNKFQYNIFLLIWSAPKTIHKIIVEHVTVAVQNIRKSIPRVHNNKSRMSSKTSVPSFMYVLKIQLTSENLFVIDTKNLNWHFFTLIEKQKSHRH